jgi:hypothetical protein
MNETIFELKKLAECYATLRVFIEKFEKNLKKNLKKFLKISVKIFLSIFFVPTAFYGQFRVCLQKFGGSRPAGLGGDRHCTNRP